MRVLLSDQELIACRAVAERTEKRFDGDRAEAFAAAKARFATWRRGGTAPSMAKLVSCAYPVVGSRRVAVQVNGEGWFKIAATASVAADVYLVAKIDSPRSVSFLGWTTPDVFVAGAKRSRGRTPTLVYQPSKDPVELFGRPIDISNLDAYRSMSLREFAGRDEAVLLRTEALGTVWLISAEAARRHVNTADPVYTAEEAIEIAKLLPEDVDRLHRFKKAIDGTVVAVNGGF